MRVALLLLLLAGVARAERFDIGANPGATNIVGGTGALGRLLYFGDSGVRLGGVWVSDANHVITGGTAPGGWTFNSLFILDLNLDLKKLIRLPGAMIGAELLRFDGMDTNGQLGSVIGYNGLPGPPPLARTELYQLWWRQALFDSKLVIRVGKTVPTYDFHNIQRPLAVRGDPVSLGSLSNMLYVPIFKTPSLLGAMPGYYNSAYGITVTVAPTKWLYLAAAIYDGNLAKGVQTGTELGPHFNGYYFAVEELGYSWRAGPDGRPGAAAVGLWMQTGELMAPGVTQQGASGIYTFVNQRLWGEAGRAIVGIFHAGINDSKTLPAHAGIGAAISVFGFVPRRPGDSLGAGVEVAWLNTRLGFNSHEVVMQAYYSAQVLFVDEPKHRVPIIMLQPTLTVAPVPGLRPGIPAAVAGTMRATVVF